MRFPRNESMSATPMLLILVLLAAVIEVDAGAVMGKIRSGNSNPNSRSLNIENQSGRKVDLYWVNMFEKPEKFVPQFVEDGVSVGCSYGADKSISSYVGHTFEIRELPSKKTEACIFDECRKVRYTVRDRQEQKIVINKDFTLTVIDERQKAYQKADEMYSRCKEKADAVVDPLGSIELLTNCMQEEMTQKINVNKEERSFQSKIHRKMVADLVPFECGDVNKTDSREIMNTTWSYYDSNDESNKDYTVRTLHELPTSKIVVVDDFIAEGTCNILKSSRQEISDGKIGIPTKIATNESKESKRMLEEFYKIYDLIKTIFPDWGELEFVSDTLFDFFKDSDGLQTPSQLCVGPEEVAGAHDEINAGKHPKCKIPGGEPVRASSKRFVVEEKGSKKGSKRQVAQFFLFCDEPEQKLGGVHFPYAGVYVAPKAGKVVGAIHRHANDPSDELDGYVDEYHFCPNHDLYTHTINHNIPAE